MIEITCDKCKKKILVRTKTVTAKVLSDFEFETVSLDEVRNYHICLDCMRKMFGEDGE